VILIDELFDNGKTLAGVKKKILTAENITITEAVLSYTHNF
jgi:hypothetical protein